MFIQKKLAIIDAALLLSMHKVKAVATRKIGKYIKKDLKT